MKQAILKLIYRVLAYYARIVIKKHNPFIVAITGSVGKTSTKEAIYEVLKDQFGKDKVRKNYGNLNAEIGIPLTILGYEKLPQKLAWPFFLILAAVKTLQKQYPKYLVLEMGVEHPGDIKYFCSIAKPNIAIITSVSPAHIAHFKDLAEYQKEKISMIHHLKSDGLAIVNGDEEALSELRSKRIKTVSIENKDSDYCVENYEVGLGGSEYRVSLLGHKILIKSKLIGKHMIYSQLFAFAVGKSLDFPLLSVAKSLEKIKPVPGRMNLLSGKNDCLIIDDTYNANPTSVKAALDALKMIKHKGRKVAIIGNMNELGVLETEAHLDIASYCIDKCDLAIFVGPHGAKMVSAIKDKAISFKNRIEFMAEASKIILPQDLILIKASQNKNFFEEIVKELMKDRERADMLLVRQGKFWLKKKNTY